VNHGQEEWVVEQFSTNTAEGYFSIFERDVKACISIAPGSICTVTLPNSISDTATALRWALMTRRAPPAWSKCQRQAAYVSAD
jgi:hypothetical protein